jgi:predicted transcriptional regulator
MIAPKPPSKQELTILALLWEHGPLTARAVLESLPDKKERAYTSVLSVLQAMERKGLVDHTTRANTNLYRPLVAQQRTVGRVLGDIVRDVFGGSRAAAVQHLLGNERVTSEELDQIEQLITELRGKQKPARKNRPEKPS